jgi:KDO2-lipid IV(A) lauroyltransferase
MGRFRKIRKSVKYSLIVAFINLILGLLQIIPWSWSRVIFARMGWLAYYVLQKERQKTLKHLKIAFGQEKSDAEIKTLARNVFINLGRSFAELAVKLRIHDKERFFKNIKVTGKEHLDNALERGKGIINIVPHIGCWEALAKAFTVMGIPAGAVGKPLSSEKLNDLVMRERQHLDFILLPRGSKYSTILKFVKDNHSLGMLIDQDTSVKGVFVDFFGKPAYTPIGAAMLALDADPVVVTVSYIYEGKGQYHLMIGEPIEIIRTGNREEELQLNTERFHAEAEALIRQYPDQWVWMHERWKTTPEVLKEQERIRNEERKKRREAAKARNAQA